MAAAVLAIVCGASVTSLNGTKTLVSGLVVSVVARQDHIDELAAIVVTGLDPDQDSATPLQPPATTDIDERCDDNDLLLAAGLS